MLLLFDFTDINECTTDTDNCDDTNGMCTNTMGSFNCACNAGFNGDGVTCFSDQGTISSFTFELNTIFVFNITIRSICFISINIISLFIIWQDKVCNDFNIKVSF